MLKEELKNTIEKAIKKLQKAQKLPGFDVSVVLEWPEQKENGDYATNVSLLAGKETGENPRKIAEKLTLELKIRGIEKIEVAGSGFINFFISPQYLQKELSEILAKKDAYGRGSVKKTVVIDYSGPNIAKRFGIGHLRSTIIGQALYNLYEFQGWKVIGDNHLGDWGTQFGVLIYEVQKLFEGKTENEKRELLKRLNVKQLEELYVKFHQKAEKNPELQEKARTAFRELEKGNKEARAIWEAARNVSLKEFNEIYKLLDVKIDNTLGESFYESQLKDIVKEAQKKNVAKESQGALIVEYDDMSPAILLKSDKGTNYFTRDLATVKYRIKKWKPSLIIYEVGAEQSLHLQQVFAASELLGWTKKNAFHHVVHGLYRTKEGKFSTRKGQTIHLRDVLKDAVKRAQTIINDSETGRNLSQKEKERVAQAVGIGGVKYNDLVQHPRKDIVFDWDKILNLKGNSAPYIQYTYARCKSILRKAKAPTKQVGYKDLSKEELDILRLLFHFPEQMKEAAERFSPNLVCSYVFNLAQAYNLFYSTKPVLQAETKEIKEFRLLLTAATAQIIKNCLSLLGIKTLERM